MLPFSLKMEREKGLDFARAFAAIGIVVFHFYCHSSSAHKLFLLHANGGWGTAINYLFFALSGYLLHKKYGKQERFCLTTFYYKRWKATMPAYIAVFLFAYFQNVASAGLKVVFLFESFQYVVSYLYTYLVLSIGSRSTYVWRKRDFLVHKNSNRWSRFAGKYVQSRTEYFAAIYTLQ